MELFIFSNKKYIFKTLDFPVAMLVCRRKLTFSNPKNIKKHPGSQGLSAPLGLRDPEPQGFWNDREGPYNIHRLK